jgi:uncharacterized protein
LSAGGVWTGLSDSAFLAGTSERERDPAHIAGGVIGGGLVGLVAAVCGMLLALACFAILTGQGARGIAGLADLAEGLRSGAAPAVSSQMLTIVLAAGVDGVFMLTFVAVAALVAGLPLIAYVTCAPRVRWRLFLLSLALAAAMMSPLVAAERLLDPQGGAPPFLAVSTLPLDRIAYGLSALLLIPAAAAEELLFRGWLLRQAGAFLRRPLPLVAVSALTFSALHFDFAPDAFLTRAVMGAGFAYMTLRLGGIEFSAGAHAVNNLMIVLFLQPLDINPGGRADLSNFSIVEDLVLIGGYVLITELVARSTVLRRLAGVRERELSPAPTISTRFG